VKRKLEAGSSKEDRRTGNWELGAESWDLRSKNRNWELRAGI